MFIFIYKEEISINKPNYQIVFIKEQFFIDYPNLKRILDLDDSKKRTHRKYLFLKFQYKGNNLLVPLRKNLNPLKKIGKRYVEIGYPVPSTLYPDAGLDFRNIMIINDNSYLEFAIQPKIPSSQHKILNNDLDIISQKVYRYVDGYIKSAIKNRVDREYKYRFSTLCNFHIELKIEELRNEKNKQKSEAAITVSIDQK